MKKLIASVLCVLLLFALVVNVGAAEEYENMTELFQHWHSVRGDYENSPYPDYVCGVWVSEDENGGGTRFHVAVTKDEAGENGKEEILSLLRDSSNLEFTYMSYSYSELWALQLELQQQMDDETGAYGMGIDESSNYIAIDFDESNPNSEQFVRDCYEKYGDRVCFFGGSGVAVDTTREETYGIDRGGGNGNQIWIVVLIAALLLAVGAAMIFRRKRSLVAVKADGDGIGNDGAIYGKNGVVPAVKASTHTPPERVYDRIKSEIEKNGK